MRWIEYTASVAIFQSRTLQCAHCSEVFVYDVKVRGTGKGTSDPNWRKVAQDRSTLAAQQDAEAKLYDLVEPVPCPSCGCYQPNMVEYFQEQHLRGVSTLGSLIVLAAVTAGGAAFM